MQELIKKAKPWHQHVGQTMVSHPTSSLSNHKQASALHANKTSKAPAKVIPAHADSVNALPSSWRTIFVETFIN
jgi:hypothetical protein